MNALGYPGGREKYVLIAARACGNGKHLSEIKQLVEAEGDAEEPNSCRNAPHHSRHTRHNGTRRRDGVLPSLRIETMGVS